MQSEIAAGGNLSQAIDQLLSTRAIHAAALAHIDQTLTSIQSLLGGAKSVVNTRPAEVSPPKTVTAPMRKRRRGPGTYASTAVEAITAFVQSRKRATTGEINDHWKELARGSKPDNTLMTMVKAGQLKRQPIEGGRGSYYSIG